MTAASCSCRRVTNADSASFCMRQLSGPNLSSNSKLSRLAVREEAEGAGELSTHSNASAWPYASPRGRHRSDLLASRRPT